jgi:hypothetical protein
MEGIHGCGEFKVGRNGSSVFCGGFGVSHWFRAITLHGGLISFSLLTYASIAKGVCDVANERE